MNQTAKKTASNGVSWTPAQLDAITARDKTLLLSAAAGSGKTATLTERVIRLLTDPKSPRDVSKMVIVTFTVAAAQDLKTKLTKALTRAISECKDPALSGHLAEQLLLVPDADVGTIDSFCRRLVTEFSDCTDLSPTFRICDPNEESHLLRDVLAPLLDRLFAGKEPDVATAEEFCDFVSHLVDPRKLDGLTDLLLDAKSRSDNLPQGVDAFDDYARYIEEVRDRPPEKTVFGEALLGRVASFASDVKDSLADCLRAAKEEPLSVQAAFLPPLGDALNLAEGLANACASSYDSVRASVLSAAELSLPRFDARCAHIREASAEFLSLARVSFSAFRDGVRETYLPLFGEPSAVWREEAAVHLPVSRILARLMRRFDRLVAEEKRRRNVASFADVERAAYRLLVAPDGAITTVARIVAGRYSDVFVDEYQDVNPLQHEIFRAISNDRNRFLVGDVKQSIYTFRGAAPSVFIGLKAGCPAFKDAAESDSAKIFLSENFRCDRPIVDFANAVFAPLFGATRESIGYNDGDDRLRFAKRPDSCNPTPILPVVKLFEKPGDGEPAEDAECAWVADEIARLIETGTRPNPDWKEGSDAPKDLPIRAEDVAILLRSASGRTSPFRAALLKRGIAVSLETKENFFDYPEVRLALCLLNAVDNPRRDIPLVGLLRSPLFDFSPDLLAEIKRSASHPELSFYDALLEYCERKPDFLQGASFLSTLKRFRRAAEGMPIDRLVWKLFTETGLLPIGGASNPDNGRENLLLFYQYARSFEATSFRGLYRFIAYLNDLEADAQKLSLQPPSNAGGVRIMTVHHSKGLEFPVVFVSRALAGGGGRSEGNAVFSTRFGLTPRIHDKTGLVRIETPFRLISELEREELEREEELRVLYVALTRARERLYVTGTLAANESADDRIAELYRAPGPLLRYDVIHKRTYPGFDKDGKPVVKRKKLTPFDWIVCALGTETEKAVLFPPADDAPAEAPEREPADDELSGKIPAENGVLLSDAEAEELLTRRFAYRYAFPWLGRVPGKLSVSTLSPAVLDGADEETTYFIPRKTADENDLPRFISGKSRLDDPALRGTATHEYLQFCDLHNLKENGAEVELNRLIDRGFLTKEAFDLVNLPELDLFRNSTLLDEMLSSSGLRRELRFNLMLPASRFTTDHERKKQLANQPVLVQGVMDCVFFTEDGELVLLDYKTDRLRGGVNASDGEIDAFVRRHRDQLYYYAEALDGIFGRRPDRVLLYPLCLGRPIPVDLADVGCKAVFDN